MSESDKVTAGRLKQWTLWPALLLSVVGLAMLYTGASDKTWYWFLPAYLLVGTPIVVGSFVSDFAGLRSLWRSRKGVGDDRW